MASDVVPKKKSTKKKKKKVIRKKKKNVDGQDIEVDVELDEESKDEN